MRYTNKQGLIVLLMGLLLLSFTPAVDAFEIPPDGNPMLIQTNGPLAPIARGDWYTSVDNGIRAGYHYFKIYIPCGWPDDLAIHLDLFSPGLNTTPGSQDEFNSQPPGNAIFELYAPPTEVGPVTAPDIPGPGAPGSLFAQTYLPNSGEQWFRFYTIPAGQFDCTGPYVLRAETTGYSENAWRIRVGYDDDNDPNTPPPGNDDDPDGIIGSGDEITIGVARTAYQHNEPGQIICLTLYEFVAPGAPDVRFQNFDMDYVPANQNARVRYYPPSAPFDPQGLIGGIPGTPSGFTQWNNGIGVARGDGDLILNPEPGWWRIVACVDTRNQFIVEGEFYTQPPTPRMTVAKDDGRVTVARDDLLTYVIDFANVSDNDPAPGAALNVTLVDTLPPEVAYVPGSCAILPPFTGSCVFVDNGGVGDQLIYQISGVVRAGAAGSVTFQARVRLDVVPPQLIENVVVLTYSDAVNRRFPPETDNDINQVIIPVVEIVKDDGVERVRVGDVLTYALDFTNISDTGPTPDTAFNIVLTDTLPGNVRYRECRILPPLTGTCGPDGAGQVIYRIDQPLPPGAGGRAELVVRVSNNALDPQFNQRVYNVVEITYTDSAGLPQPPDRDDDLNILDTSPLPVPLMTIQKDNWTEQVQKGDRLTYRIDFANISNTTPTPETAHNVVITDVLPRNTTYESCAILPPFTGTCGPFDEARQVFYRLNETVAPGQGGRVLLEVTVAPWADEAEFGLRVENLVHLDYTDPRGNPQPRVSDIDIDVLIISTESGNVQMSKRAQPPFAQPGQQVTWQITVSNISDVAVPDVRMVDVVPAELEIISATATAGRVEVEGQTVRWGKDPLLPREVVVITIVTRVRPETQVPFSITNVAEVTVPGQPPTRTSGRLLSVTTLPATGEPLLARDLLLASAGGVLLALGGVVYAVSRRRTPAA